MTPFEQGYAAFLAGKADWANPFDADTTPWSRKRWADGWRVACSRRLERAT